MDRAANENEKQVMIQAAAARRDMNSRHQPVTATEHTSLGRATRNNALRS